IEFPFIHSYELVFIPQGIVMTFYGTIAIVTSMFLWLTILWNVGSGYNKFNNDKGVITIFRKGFPGKNRELQLNYNVNEIEAIKITIEEGLTQKREIYLKTKDSRQIPLTRVGEPLLISEMEEQATSIAKFLGIAIESETSKSN
ncbi:photosystem I assembly protein Ycf4, partial [Bacillus mycoides]|uniref:photosystem I assembly protein Ycf4 n=1 Tax=Bacillus mycoides TaxID=1405 RepID=UPI003D658CB0